MTIRSFIVDAALIKDVDAATIDRLARLHCAVRRSGGRLRLVNADKRLLELIELCGLSRVLSVEPGR